MSGTIRSNTFDRSNPSPQGYPRSFSGRNRRLSPHMSPSRTTSGMSQVESNAANNQLDLKLAKIKGSVKLVTISVKRQL